MTKLALKFTIFALLSCIGVTQMHGAWLSKIAPYVSKLTNRLSDILDKTALEVENPLEALRLNTIANMHKQCPDINQEPHRKQLLKNAISKSNAKGVPDKEAKKLAQDKLHLFDLPAELLDNILEPLGTTPYSLASVFEQLFCDAKSLAILPGSILASSKHRGITLWNFRTGKYQNTLGLSLSQRDGHNGLIYALAALPDGTLASGSHDKTIKIWNTSTRECIKTLHGHEGSVTSLAALPEGMLASGSHDGTIKVWNISTRECIKTLRGHEHNVTSLAVLPEGMLASGSCDHTVKIWNIATEECLHTLHGHQNTVTSLACFDKNLLASGSDDGTIKIWNTTDGSCSKTFNAHMQGVASLAALPDGTLASGSKSGSVKFWDIRTGTCLNMLCSHTGAVTSLAACPSKNGRLFSASSHDQTINTFQCMPFFGRSCEQQRNKPLYIEEPSLRPATFFAGFTSAISLILLSDLIDRTPPHSRYLLATGTILSGITACKLFSRT